MPANMLNFWFTYMDGSGSFDRIKVMAQFQMFYKYNKGGNIQLGSIFLFGLNAIEP